MSLGETVFRAYFNVVKRLKWFWIVFWTLVLPLGVFVGFRLLKETEFTFAAPKGTAGYEARKVFESSFPNQQGESTIIIYLNCENCTDITADGYSSEAMKTLNATAWEWQTNNTASGGNEIVKSINSYWSYENRTCQYNLNFTSIIPDQFKPFCDLPLPKHPKAHCVVPIDQSDCYNSVASVYLSKSLNDSTATIMQLQYQTGHPIEGGDLITELRDKITDLEQDGYYLGLTAQAALIQDMETASHHDIAIKDPIVLPIALIVLAFVVRSWRLMFIPIFCVSCSVCLSYTIMYPVAATRALSCSPFMPTIMISVTIAMSIDYSLFLLTRFREEIDKGREVEEAVRNMTRYAGHVVVVSGLILSITYAGLALFPMDMLISVGVGAATAILCTIFVNLTLTPALLLSCPNFFKQKTSCNCCNKEDKYNDNVLLQGSIGRIEKLSDADESAKLKRDKGKCGWFCWGRITTNCPANIILFAITYACIAPVGWQLTTFKYQIDGRLVFPASSKAIETSNRMTEHFPAGEISPFFIIARTRDTEDDMNKGTGIYNDTYLSATCETMNRMVELGYANSTDFRSLNYLPHPLELLSNYTGKEITNITNPFTKKPFNLTVWIDPIEIDCLTGGHITGWYVNSTGNFTFNAPYTGAQLLQILEQYPPYQLLWNQTVGTNATLITFQIPLDPFGSEIQNYTSSFRGFLANETRDKTDVSYYVSGATVDELDSVDQIYAIFPMMLAIIVSAIFVLMGLTFKSVFVPIRLFLTITVPLTFVYGMSIIIYQDGHIQGGPFQGTGGLYWITPVMSVTILVGLALDYDVFLFARIHEYRQQEGFGTRAAIIRGVSSTGGVITAAGVIMAIAFSGLLMSDIRSLNQFGFILCAAVLVDTFIIRTALVPAVLSLAGEVNWWPSSMPTEGLKDEYGDPIDQDGYYAPGAAPNRDDPPYLSDSEAKGRYSPYNKY